MSWGNQNRESPRNVKEKEIEEAINDMKKNREEEHDYPLCYQEMVTVVDNPILDVCLYLRVSTIQQHNENQFEELNEICYRNKWNIVRVYDEKISGITQTQDRRGLKQMMLDAKRKRFDKVVVWSVDRMSRSMSHLVSCMSELRDTGCDIYSFRQGLDTGTDMGRSFFYMIGIFAELETNLRKERLKIGIKKAIDRGAKFGRKSIMTDALVKRIRRMRKDGQSMRMIAVQLKISTGTVQKACALKVIKNTQLNSA